MKKLILSILFFAGLLYSFKLTALNNNILYVCHLDPDFYRERDLFPEVDFSSSRLRRDRNDSIEEAFSHFCIIDNISSLAAQSDSKVTQVFTLIYNARFDEAEKLLENSGFQTESFYFQVLKLDLFWWKYSISKSETDEERLSSTLDWFSKQNKNSAFSEINWLIWLAYKMRFEVKRKNYVKAFLLKGEVADQLEMIQKNPVTLPDDEQKLLEVFTLLLQYSDEAGSVFGNNPKKQACLNGLQKLAADSDWIVSSEAHYFLGRIYTKMEREPQKARIHFQTLNRRFPQNTLFADLAVGKATDF